MSVVPIQEPVRLPTEAGALPNIQPGGGCCMRLELAWGRLRRSWLRTFRPGYVRRMAALRQGECLDCPHDIVDPRDLKFYRNACGYWFRPEDDQFRWRDRLGLARVGLCEVLFSSLVIVALIAGIAFPYAFGWISPWLFWPLLIILVLIWIEMVTFFRDPERVIPSDPSLLVSPADGKVVEVGEVEEPGFPGRRAVRVGIFLSIFNVHVNRIPRAGRVVGLRYFPGKFFNALRPRSLRENEQLWLDLEEPDTGRRIRVKQIAGAIARRIVCWLKPGEQVEAGPRYGMIKFGSRTEVYVPAESRAEVLVQVGQSVKGGASVLMRFPTETSGNGHK